MERGDTDRFRFTLQRGICIFGSAATAALLLPKRSPRAPPVVPPNAERKHMLACAHA
jgi:hypothetical protein